MARQSPTGEAGARLIAQFGRHVLQLDRGVFACPGCGNIRSAGFPRLRGARSVSRHQGRSVREQNRHEQGTRWSEIRGRQPGHHGNVGGVLRSGRPGICRGVRTGEGIGIRRNGRRDARLPAGRGVSAARVSLRPAQRSTFASALVLHVLTRARPDLHSFRRRPFRVRRRPVGGYLQRGGSARESFGTVEQLRRRTTR